jgi:hypothetical protein
MTRTLFTPAFPIPDAWFSPCASDTHLFSEKAPGRQEHEIPRLSYKVNEKPAFP